MSLQCSCSHPVMAETPIGILLPGTELLDSPVRSLVLDHSRGCLSGCPWSFLMTAEFNKYDITATVMSLQRSWHHLPMVAIKFTVKFELPAPHLISLEQTTL